MQSHIRSCLLICLLISLAHESNGHMEMITPFPRRSPKNPSAANKDFDINAPLGPGISFPCRGAPKGATTATLNPGSNFDVKLFGSATHGGGHCQFSISYDGQKFVALRTIMSECMLNGLDFQVPVPQNLPAGPAVFAWTWVNAVGNREMYMNCADVLVSGNAQGTFQGPEIVVANIPGAPEIGEFGFGADPQVAMYRTSSVISIGPGGQSNQPPTRARNQPTVFPPTRTRFVNMPNPSPTSIVDILPSLVPSNNNERYSARIRPPIPNAYSRNGAQIPGNNCSSSATPSPNLPLATITNSSFEEALPTAIFDIPPPSISSVCSSSVTIGGILPTVIDSVPTITNISEILSTVILNVPQPPISTRSCTSSINKTLPTAIFEAPLPPAPSVPCQCTSAIPTAILDIPPVIIKPASTSCTSTSSTQSALPTAVFEAPIVTISRYVLNAVPTNRPKHVNTPAGKRRKCKKISRRPSY